MSAAARPDPALLRAFAATVRERAEREVARDREEGLARREAIVARVRDVTHQWRSGGGRGRVWLFGSYAWGTPDEQSDLDLMVDGVYEADALADDVARASGLPVHLVRYEAAAVGLRQRVESEGIVL